MIILIFFAVSACSDHKIDPFEETEGIFSVYGTLFVGESPNQIRVRNLNASFGSEKASLDDVIVTFENLDRGTSVVLEDSVVWF